MAQRGCRIHGGKDFTSCGLDVPFEPLDPGLKIAVGVLLRRQIGGCLLALGNRSLGRLPAVFELEPRRFTPCVQRRDLGFDFRGGHAERLDLMSIEGDLLLQPADGELAGMSQFPRFGLSRIRLGQLEPKRFGRSLDFGEMSARARFPLARLRQLRACRLDGDAERAVPLGELHLLPAAQFLAQPPVAPGFRGLPLQRSALLLHFEHDVVDAGQVLLRGFEFQLGSPPAALVLGDASRLFDQLAAIGGSGTEDLTDLSLLDDGVALDPDARVHQQVLDVLQPADLAIDQVFALTGSIQPAHQLHVADDERSLVFEQCHCRRRENAVGSDLGVGLGHYSLDVSVAVPVVALPVVAVAIPTVAIGLVAVAAGLSRTARRDTTELEANFGGGRRFPGVAAAENHVLHAIAAKALRALFAEHPRERVHDVALPAPVRTNDRGDPGIECQLGSIGKALEAGNLQAVQSHDVQVPQPKNEKAASHSGCGRIGCGSGWDASKR